MHIDIAQLCTMLLATFLLMRSGWTLFEEEPEFVFVNNGDPSPPPREDKKAWEATVMFKKGGGGSAPSPDPNIGIAAMKEAQTSAEYLQFAKEQFAVANARQDKQDAISNEVTNQQLGAARQAQGWATQDRARYENTFIPLQDEFIKTAQGWDSKERQDKLASEAKADVLNNAAQQRQSSQRQMSAMGVDPTSGRYAGIDRAGEMATGLAAAGAENTSRNQVRKEAVAMKGDAINLGSGLGVNPASSLGLGVQSAASAYGTTAANNAQAVSNNNIMTQGYQTRMQGLSSQASILNQQYGNQLNAWSAQQQASASNSSGMMGGIGSMAGMGLVAF